ncbi:MAG: hypothetical protein HY046_00720 [Acidobacteria bacterium]|nr:hypothetical protein [Acidobacteriota bacterium]
MKNAEQDFKDELEIFRTESESASQFFYAYLAVDEVAKHNKRVLRLLNENPLFWNTVVGALQSSALIALHRVFNNRSRHNVDSLLCIAEASPSIFSIEALGRRIQSINQVSQDWLDEFLKSAHHPTTDDFKRIRGHVEKHKQIYETKYAGLRNKVFAHRVASGSADIQILVAKTNIHELERMFVFLLKLHEAFWQQFFNGRRLLLRPLRHSARRLRDSPPASIHSRGVHERISREVANVLLTCASKLRV